MPLSALKIIPYLERQKGRTRGRKDAGTRGMKMGKKLPSSSSPSPSSPFLLGAAPFPQSISSLRGTAFYNLWVKSKFILAVLLQDRRI
ncbi:hypothetical protein, partial [Microseira wollei]|uniref:hypothetical protein n=1 Tax=Microseira wollei TaxID=467598 RepID=UPI001CFCBAC2